MPEDGVYTVKRKKDNFGIFVFFRFFPLPQQFNRRLCMLVGPTGRLPKIKNLNEFDIDYAAKYPI